MPLPLVNWSSPGPIGATPNTGKFTTLVANSPSVNAQVDVLAGSSATNGLQLKSVTGGASTYFAVLKDWNDATRVAIGHNPASPQSGTHGADTEVVLGQWNIRTNASGALTLGRFGAATHIFGDTGLTTPTVSVSALTLPNWGGSGTDTFRLGQYGFRSNIGSGSSLVCASNINSNRLFNIERDTGKFSINSASDHYYTAQLGIRNSAAATVGFRLDLFASQAANAFEIRNSSATILAAFGANGALQIGSSGSPIKYVLAAIATLDFPSIAAGGSADLTITVTGAAVGDVVMLGLPATPPVGVDFSAFVSSANTVMVRAQVYATSAIDPPLGSYRVAVIGF